MRNRIHALAVVVLLGVVSSANAQAADPCPALPADSGLTWEHKTTAGMQFCTAVRGDGSEAFGLYMAKDSAFEPSRSARAEASEIDGRPVHWYRSEIAGKPDLQARETLFRLADGRVAHVWIQARSKDELGEAIARTRALRFGASAQLSTAD